MNLHPLGLRVEYHPPKTEPAGVWIKTNYGQSLWIASADTAEEIGRELLRCAEKMRAPTTLSGS
jgi:hypothetical protein